MPTSLSDLVSINPVTWTLVSTVTATGLGSIPSFGNQPAGIYEAITTNGVAYLIAGDPSTQQRAFILTYKTFHGAAIIDVNTTVTPGIPFVFKHWGGNMTCQVSDTYWINNSGEIEVKLYRKTAKNLVPSLSSTFLYLPY